MTNDINATVPEIEVEETPEQQEAEVNAQYVKTAATIIQNIISGDSEQAANVVTNLIRDVVKNQFSAKEPEVVEPTPEVPVVEPVSEQPLKETVGEEDTEKVVPEEDNIHEEPDSEGYKTIDVFELTDTKARDLTEFEVSLGLIPTAEFEDVEIKGIAEVDTDSKYIVLIEDKEQEDLPFVFVTYNIGSEDGSVEPSFELIDQYSTMDEALANADEIIDKVVGDYSDDSEVPSDDVSIDPESLPVSEDQLNKEQM